MEYTIAMISAGIAFVSMIITASISTLNYIQNKKINEISLKSSYYEKIFDSHLITGIPNARKYIRFQGDKLEDVGNLVTELTLMRSDALFFKYTDESFYSNLKKTTQDIEDYLMEIGNKKCEQEEQADVYLEIHKKISNLYQIINDAHIKG